MPAEAQCLRSNQLAVHPCGPRKARIQAVLYPLENKLHVYSTTYNTEKFKAVANQQNFFCVAYAFNVADIRLMDTLLEQPFCLIHFALLYRSKLLQQRICSFKNNFFSLKI